MKVDLIIFIKSYLLILSIVVYFAKLFLNSADKTEDEMDINEISYISSVSALGRTSQNTTFRQNSLKFLLRAQHLLSMDTAWQPLIKTSMILEKIVNRFMIKIYKMKKIQTGDTIITLKIIINYLYIHLIQTSSPVHFWVFVKSC